MQKKRSTPKPPKTSTLVFTTRKPRQSIRMIKLKKDDDDDDNEETNVTLKKPPITFEQRVNEPREGSGMGAFRLFKYVIRSLIPDSYV